MHTNLGIPFSGRPNLRNSGSSRPPWSIRFIAAISSYLIFAPAVSPLGAQFNELEIQSFLTGLCLQPVNESTAQGAPIVQLRCTGGQAQQWRKVQLSGGVFHFVNVLTGLCLDARGSAANRTPVQQWTCNNISNENWQPGDSGDDDVPPLYSRVSGTRSYCLDVPGGSKTAGLVKNLAQVTSTQEEYVTHVHLSANQC